MQEHNVLCWIGTTRPRSDFISDADVERLESATHVRFVRTEGKTFSLDDVARESRGISVVIGTWATPAYSDKVLERCPDLKVYGRVGGSVRNIVGRSAWERGVRVITAVRAQGTMLAELTLTLMLAGLHRLPHHLKQQAGSGVLAHDGGKSPLAQYSLLEKQVGLVGFGSIAQQVSGLVKPFGCSVSAYDPHVPPAVYEKLGVKQVKDLGTLFESSDIISVHSARLPETRGMVTRDLIYRLREGGMIVDTAWSELVDIEALAERLEDGSLYACFDCLDLDRLKPIRSNPFCIITTGIAVQTDAMPLMGREIVDDVLRFIRGEPMRCEVSKESLATRG